MTRGYKYQMRIRVLIVLWPERVPGLPNVRTLSVSESHLCALGNTGQALCIGQEGDGELGVGSPLGVFTTTSAREVLAAPGNVSVYATILVGWASSCAITDKGMPYCWSVGARIGVGGDGGAQRTPIMHALPVVP